MLRSERAFEVRQAYQRALTRLRQAHDAEFHAILAEEYEAMGLDVRKRKSRIAAAAARQGKDHDGRQEG